jgi:hypothetical protein
MFFDKINWNIRRNQKKYKNMVFEKFKYPIEEGIGGHPYNT